MIRTIRTLLLAALVILLAAVPALAGGGSKGREARTVLHRCVGQVNPDGRTSVTVTAGLGSLDGMIADGDADLTTYGVALVHPATRDLSFLAQWDHSDAEWDGTAARWPGLSDWDSDTFTLGFRFYFGN